MKNTFYPHFTPERLTLQEEKHKNLTISPNTTDLIVGDIHNTGKRKRDLLMKIVEQETYGKVSRIITMGDIDGMNYIHIRELQESLKKELGIDMHHILGNHDLAHYWYLLKENESFVENLANVDADARLLKDEFRVKILRFITEEMYDSINLGNIHIRHAAPPVTTQEGLIKRWPGDSDDTYNPIYDFLRKKGDTNMILGHAHKTYSMGHRGEITDLTLSKMGLSSGALSLQDHPIVTLGSYDEQGYILAHTTDKNLHQTFTLHREHKKDEEFRMPWD